MIGIRLLIPISDLAAFPSAALEIGIAEDEHRAGVYMLGSPADGYVGLEYADHDSTVYHVCGEGCELESECCLRAAGSRYCVEEYHSGNLKEI